VPGGIQTIAPVDTRDVPRQSDLPEPCSEDRPHPSVPGPGATWSAKNATPMPGPDRSGALARRNDGRVGCAHDVDLDRRPSRIGGAS
jgi:hypothetical protein